MLMKDLVIVFQNNTYVIPFVSVNGRSLLYC